MKRLLVLVALVALLLVLTTASAPAVPKHQVASGPAPGFAGLHAMSATYVPLGARLADATVNGTVYTSAGAGVPYASMEGWSFSGGAWSGRTAQSDANGVYSMAVVPGTDCWMYAYTGNGDPFLGRGGDTWADGVTYYGRDLTPGAVNVTANRGGRWGDFSEIWIYFWNDASDCRGVVYPTDTTTTPVESFVDILDGTYAACNAYFFFDEGLEVSGSWSVPALGSCPTHLTLNEVDAQRVWLQSPYWGSGKPGATVKIAHDNFPAGWVDAVSGHTYDDGSPAPATYPNYVSSGPATATVSLKIPKAASPGHSYVVVFEHQGGSSLYLQEYYQVCTIKPSKTSIRRGAKIRVSGVVPVEGHQGTTPGTPKKVTLYAHKGSAPVPTKWNPKSKGWVKVCTAKTNGLGAYKTPYFKPLKSLTLVVRYPGDNWYWPAYTSTAKVKVR